MMKLLRSKWTISVGWGLLICCILWLYQSLYLGLNIYSLNRSFADTAFVLISLSLLGASFYYFTKKAQILLTYRKFVGIVGFFFGFFHALISIYFYFFFADPIKPNFESAHLWPIIEGFFVVNNMVAFFLGLSADIIFALMTLISLKYFILKLGGILWRKLLRYLGYTAYVFVMLHYFIKSANVWQHPETWVTLPPVSLILSLLGFIVLIFRISLYVSLKEKKKQSDLQSSGPSGN